MTTLAELARQPFTQNGATHRLIVVDDNMYYRSMRQECYRLARQLGTAYVQVHLQVPLELALQRNRDRQPDMQVPESALRRMAASFEEPGAAAGRLWEKHTLTVGQEEGVETLWARIWLEWGAAPPALPDLASRCRCAACPAFLCDDDTLSNPVARTGHS
jgi:tRNA uridine 5-carbamoylmethylation protein Kti12